VFPGLQIADVEDDPEFRASIIHSISGLANVPPDRIMVEISNGSIIVIIIVLYPPTDPEDAPLNFTKTAQAIADMNNGTLFNVEIGFNDTRYGQSTITLLITVNLPNPTFAPTLSPTVGQGQGGKNNDDSQGTVLSAALIGSLGAGLVLVAIVLIAICFRLRRERRKRRGRGPRVDIKRGNAMHDPNRGHKEAKLTSLGLSNISDSEELPSYLDVFQDINQLSNPSVWPDVLRKLLVRVLTVNETQQSLLKYGGAWKRKFFHFLSTKLADVEDFQLPPKSTAASQGYGAGSKPETLKSWMLRLGISIISFVDYQAFHGAEDDRLERSRSLIAEACQYGTQDQEHDIVKLWLYTLFNRLLNSSPNTYNPPPSSGQVPNSPRLVGYGVSRYSRKTTSSTNTKLSRHTKSAKSFSTTTMTSSVEIERNHTYRHLLRVAEMALDTVMPAGRHGALFALAIQGHRFADFEVIVAAGRALSRDSILSDQSVYRDAKTRNTYRKLIRRLRAHSTVLEALEAFMEAAHDNEDTIPRKVNSGFLPRDSDTGSSSYRSGSTGREPQDSPIYRAHEAKNRPTNSTEIKAIPNIVTLPVVTAGGDEQGDEKIAVDSKASSEMTGGENKVTPSSRDGKASRMTRSRGRGSIRREASGIVREKCESKEESNTPADSQSDRDFQSDPQQKGLPNAINNLVRALISPLLRLERDGVRGTAESVRSAIHFNLRRLRSASCMDPLQALSRSMLRRPSAFGGTQDLEPTSDRSSIRLLSDDHATALDLQIKPENEIPTFRGGAAAYKAILCGVNVTVIVLGTSARLDGALREALRIHQSACAVCPSVVQLFGCGYSGIQGRWFTVVERIGRPLSTALEDIFPPLPPYVTARAATSLATALELLHSMGLSHYPTPLTPDCLLLLRDMTLKLGGLGVGALALPVGLGFETAPEVKDGPKKSKKFRSAARKLRRMQRMDIFGLGVVVRHLLLDEKRSESLEPSSQAEMKRIVSSCCDENPHRRPPAGRVAEWLRSLESKLWKAQEMEGQVLRLGQMKEGIIEKYLRIDCLVPGTQNVYKARLHGVDIAVKTLGVKELQLSAQREIKILQDCSRSSYVIDMLGCGYSERFGWYMAMEFITLNMRNFLTKNPNLSMQQRLCLGLMVSEGVAFLHRFGIFHRDIKPSNILVNERFRIKLCDFGLSRRFRFAEGDSMRTTDLTITGGSAAIIGTPAYMAPELQILSRRSIKLSSEGQRKADVYSLGVTLLEILSNRKPEEFLLHIPKAPEIIGRSPKPGPAFQISPALTEGIPVNALECIKSCICTDYEHRPEASTVCEILERAENMAASHPSLPGTINTSPVQPSALLNPPDSHSFSEMMTPTDVEESRNTLPSTFISQPDHKVLTSGSILHNHSTTFFSTQHRSVSQYTSPKQNTSWGPRAMLGTSTSLTRSGSGVKEASSPRLPLNAPSIRSNPPPRPFSTSLTRSSIYLESQRGVTTSMIGDNRRSSVTHGGSSLQRSRSFVREGSERGKLGGEGWKGESQVDLVPKDLSRELSRDAKNVN